MDNIILKINGAMTNEGRGRIFDDVSDELVNIDDITALTDATDTTHTLHENLHYFNMYVEGKGNLYILVHSTGQFLYGYVLCEDLSINKVLEKEIELQQFLLDNFVNETIYTGLSGFMLLLKIYRDRLNKDYSTLFNPLLKTYKDRVNKDYNKLFKL